MLHDMDEFRKDPAILFGVPSATSDEPTRKLNPDEVMQAVRKSRTTAEKVAGAAGAVAAASARTAGDLKRQQQAAEAANSSSNYLPQQASPSRLRREVWQLLLLQPCRVSGGCS